MGTNWALSSNGCTATASTGGVGGTAAKTNDGVRHTNNNWPTDGFDSGLTTSNIVYDFGSSRSISEVDLFTIADAVNYNTNPTLSDTCTSFGIKDYTVDYWNGSAWVNLITVTTNTKVWRQHTFTPVNTTKMRWGCTLSYGGTTMRAVEFEAWEIPATITTTSPLSNVTEGLASTHTIAATGGFGSLTFSKTGGSSGTSINGATGVISDSDLTVGSRTITAIVTDSLGTASSPVTFTWDVVAFDYPFGDELSLEGLEIDGYTLGVEMLRCDFGAGYGAAASVGTGSGLFGWEIKSDVLTDDDAYNDLIDDLPTFEYYRQFILDHTEGAAGTVFYIDFRGKKYHASFDLDSLSGTMHTYDLFSMEGVKLQMRRLPGTIYNDDGSIFEPSSWIRADAITGKVDADSMAGTGTWHGYSNGSVWDVASDGTTPTYETNEANSLPVVRLTDGHVALSGTISVYDIFLVVKIREATFSAARGLIACGTTDFLKGSNGTTKFADVAAGLQYRMNGTLYAAGNLQAPMNAFGIVHLRATSTPMAFTTSVVIGQDHPLAVAGKCDLAEAIICTTQPTAATYALITNSLKRRYAIS